MGFFDNIGKTLSNAGQTIAQKSKDVVDTAKLNSAISDEQKIITNAYEKIGRLYVERHADYPEPDFVEYLDEIKAAQNAIAECEQKTQGFEGCFGMSGMRCRGWRRFNVLSKLWQQNAHRAA